MEDWCPLPAPRGRTCTSSKSPFQPAHASGLEDHSLHDGAIVWYVKSGEVEFGIDLLEGSPPPDLTLLDSDGIAKPLATLMTLSAGDSLSAGPCRRLRLPERRQRGRSHPHDCPGEPLDLDRAEFSPIPDPMRDCQGHCRNIRR